MFYVYVLPSKELRPRGSTRVKGFAPRGRARVKRSASQGRGNRVKGFASRGVAKKWILVLLVAFLLIPAMQVAVVRFINPPLTLPMLIERSAMFSSTPKPPLRLDRFAADS